MDGIRISSFGTGAMAQAAVASSNPAPAGLTALAQAGLQAADRFQQALQTATSGGPAATGTRALDTAQTVAPVAAAQTATPPPLPDTTGATLDFALQAALRFGAGVGAPGTPPIPTPDLATGPVRDPVAVLRSESTRAQAGGPGPGAFARSPFGQAALRTYQAALPPATQGSVDLLA